MSGSWRGAGGHVDVVLLGITGRGVVTADVIEKVRAKLLADDGAPATDVIAVVGARIVPYAVAVTVHVALGQDPVSVKANALAALQAYVDERHRIGVTVAASGLWRAAHVPNAERVEAIAPVADIFVKPDEPRTAPASRSTWWCAMSEEVDLSRATPPN